MAARGKSWADRSPTEKTKNRNPVERRAQEDVIRELVVFSKENDWVLGGWPDVRAGVTLGVWFHLHRVCKKCDGRVWALGVVLTGKILCMPCNRAKIASGFDYEILVRES